VAPEVVTYGRSRYFWRFVSGHEPHAGVVNSKDAVKERSGGGISAGAQADRPMDVLFLNPSGQLGGAERSLLDVMASLREREPSWKLGLVVTAEGPLVDKARDLGVQTEVLPLPSVLAELGDGGAVPRGRRRAILSLLRAAPAAVLYAIRLRKRIALHGPRVVHSNGLKMHVLGAWARPAHIPLVWHVHDFVSRRPVMSLLLRRHTRRCAAVVANSKSVAADLMEICNGALDVHLVYNAVDLKAFSPHGRTLDLDALSGMPPPEEGTLRVGLVATLGWWKGHQTFLQAIADLPADLRLRAYIVGGPLYETRFSQHDLGTLRKRAEELGVADRVGFTGFVDDVPSAMRALDVVVHASTEPEAFGLVIIEGMASQRAVIASEAGGAAELIAGGVNALGHRPGDARDLARCIETLARDPELRIRMAQNGRTIVEREFDRSRLAEDLLPIYSRVARGAKRSTVHR
jgi:glycosyltransferase involved in cell wall biosynthesis